MAILVKNIKLLVQVEEKPVIWRAGKEMQTLHTIEDAYLLTDGELLVDFGKMCDFPSEKL
jgi:imidazolonepropionase